MRTLRVTLVAFVVSHRAAAAISSAPVAVVLLLTAFVLFRFTVPEVPSKPSGRAEAAVIAECRQPAQK